LLLFAPAAEDDSTAGFLLLSSLAGEG